MVDSVVVWGAGVEKINKKGHQHTESCDALMVQELGYKSWLRFNLFCCYSDLKHYYFTSVIKTHTNHLEACRGQLIFSQPVFVPPSSTLHHVFLHIGPCWRYFFHVLFTKGSSKRAFFCYTWEPGRAMFVLFFERQGRVLHFVIDQKKNTVCIILLEDTMFAGLLQNVARGGLAYFILKDLNGNPLVLFLLTSQWKSYSFRAWTQQQALSGWPITASCSFLFPLPLFWGVLLFFFLALCLQSVSEWGGVSMRASVA